ncbi:SDR family oxidoreductase [Alkalibaculum sp. M08DMB]|uniref:SDR family oxidoreductase n=1 Tax=Alkalibaculum sporogenes TaxID=2655001 RepID=A0A6A7K7N4_9FIRM|nr:SDR family NAD(P)-dependent oxidoreductase [Alkalibaculum sporogenes]MPW25405.1 SDR family oxidoreductase [Alkalibaculum sporogenes]
MDLFDLQGKKAIVTGGSRGLGYGMVQGLLEAGCEVVIIGSSDKALTVSQDFIKQGYKCHGIKADLKIEDENNRSFNEAVEYFKGDLDILVTAAGIQRRHNAENFPLKDWEEVLNVNLNSVFLMCQLAGNLMLKKGHGKIINVASMLSFFGGNTVCAYAASKGGVAQFTKALSNEWASKGINVNAIAPGYMATEMNIALIEDETRNTEILSRIPAKRWGKPEDMKGLVIFLASQASDYLNGAIIPVDGGYLSR